MSFSLKAVLRAPNNNILLVRRGPGSKSNAGKWEFPGGKTEKGESIDAALVREVREETGLEVTVGPVLGSAESSLPDRRVIYLFFEARASSEEVRLSEEHDQCAWVALDDLLHHDLSPQFRGFAKALQGSGGQPVLVTTQNSNKELQMPIDHEWLEGQIQRYCAEKPHYITYAKALEPILKAAASLYSSESIVQTREKALPSFAEKAVRKRAKYDDPAFQLTDLCGARVVVFTESQMQAVCRFIRENFIVDEANSDDAAARLKPSEFGYRSIHFVVQVRKPEILGIAVPLAEIGDRKAEIQVRTQLQHAWASVTHDRLYKGDFKPARRLERASSRLAALLEEAETVVEDFDVGMQEYQGNHAAYLPGDKLRLEMEIQQLVLSLESVEKKAAVALKLAKLAQSAGDLDLALKTLDSVGNVPESFRLEFDFRHGSVLLQRSRRNEQSDDFKKGLDLLQKIARVPKPGEPIKVSFDRQEEKLRSEAAALIADALSRIITKQIEAPLFFDLALKRDPTDPYHLVSLFEFRPALTQGERISEAVRPALWQAIAVCQRHVVAGLELPRAWLTMGRLHFLLEQPYPALDNYAKAIWFYRSNPGVHWEERDWQGEIEFLHRVYRAVPGGQFRWIEKLLQIGWSVIQKHPKDVAHLTGSPVLHTFPAEKRVLIIAGGTRPEYEIEAERYQQLLAEAIDGFDGTIVSGGTTCGIPGRVSVAVQKLRQTSGAPFAVVGYYPEAVRKSMDLDRTNYTLFEIPSDPNDPHPVNDFSAAEPLQNWIDLLASGVEPKNVRLLGVNGGDITRFEYALALALGATVGVLESSGRSASEIFLDPDWSKLPTLLPLPEDQMTLHAFVQVETAMSHLANSQLEAMARKVHEIYLRTAKPNYKKPATLPWEYLPEDFIFSNKAQAAYIPHIVHRFGYRVVPKTPGSKTSFPFPKDKQELEKMAEMEHGRWNVERLLRDWRYAPKKDDELKRSPYLIPWSLVPEEVREYDRQAVGHFQEVLAAGGFELIKD